MSSPYILVVDDEPDIRNLVQEILEDEGYNVGVARSGESARQAIAEQVPQLVLLDIWMPDEDGISLLKDWRESGQLVFPVVMISGHGTVETAVEATRHGAVDFIEKPLSLAKLLLTVEKALQIGAPSGDDALKAGQTARLADLVGNSEYIKSLRQQIAELGASDRNVLITGEPASGRMLVGEHLHAASSRQGGPLIILRCDSLSTANSARELLGDTSQHGALNSGYLDSAHGGTLFLKDLEQLPEVAQTLLLDVLKTGEVRKPGSVARQPLNIRFFASTAFDKQELLKSGGFLPELCDRLCEETILCQALREHPEDIPALLEYYVNWFVETESLPYRHFTVAAQNRLRNQPWPGNLMELKNLVQRMMILSPGIEIDVGDLDAGPQTASDNAGALDDVSLDVPLREARAAFERAYMLHQLTLAEGNIGELAKRVGMERTHLYRKLRSLEIDLGKVRD